MLQIDQIVKNKKLTNDLETDICEKFDIDKLTLKLYLNNMVTFKQRCESAEKKNKEYYLQYCLPGRENEIILQLLEQPVVGYRTLGTERFYLVQVKEQFWEIQIMDKQKSKTLPSSTLVFTLFNRNKILALRSYQIQYLDRVSSLSHKSWMKLREFIFRLNFIILDQQIVKELNFNQTELTDPHFY